MTINHMLSIPAGAGVAGVLLVLECSRPIVEMIMSYGPEAFTET